VTSKVRLLSQIAMASLGMFFVAHSLLFRLFLPSRYTIHSLRVAMALAAGIALTIVLDAVFHGAGTRARSCLREREFVALGLTVLVAGVLIAYPAL
jgi:hypothetical protein